MSWYGLAAPFLYNIRRADIVSAKNMLTSKPDAYFYMNFHTLWSVTIILPYCEMILSVILEISLRVKSSICKDTAIL